MKVLVGKLSLDFAPQNPEEFDPDFWFYDKLSWGLLSSWSNTIKSEDWPEGDWIIIRPQGSQYDVLALWTSTSPVKWVGLKSLIEKDSKFYCHKSLGEGQLKNFPSEWGVPHKLNAKEAQT